jgi:hypothetical protein
MSPDFGCGESIWGSKDRVHVVQATASGYKNGVRNLRDRFRSRISDRRSCQKGFTV